MRLVFACTLMMLASPGMSLDVGEDDFAFSSDLVAAGYVPFATSNAGNAIYGMTNQTDMYLCFIADAGEDQAKRQRVLLAELAGESHDKTVPNIPVACIKTQ